MQILQVTLVALKLVGVLNISWVVALIPLWIFSAAATATVLAILLTVLYYTIGRYRDRRRRRKNKEAKAYKRRK